MAERPTQPPSNSRRRLLVAAGFGAANLAIARSLGLGSESLTPSAEPPDRGSGPSDTVELATEIPVAPASLDDAGPELPPDHVFDVVIGGGRVIDPASGFDGMVDIGIDGSTITAIARPPLLAQRLVDASGRVVAPGFVDILSYEPNPLGVWFKVADGVTTNLAMHGVNNYAGPFFERYEGTTPVHFGGAFHQHFLRGEEFDLRPEESLDEAQLASFSELARVSLATGYAGVSFSPEYSPGTSQAEIDALAGVAAESDHVAFFHVRFSDPDLPGTSLEAIQEAIDVGRRTGIGVHVEHLTSTGGTFVMSEALSILESARSEGIDVTACVYPYDFWGTTLASYRFAGDWQQRYRLTYDDLQIAGTTTRLSEATYDAALADNKLVAALGSIPEPEVQMALRTPWIMIGSDAILTESRNNHPRASGTFSRVLGRYVRELRVLDLSAALAKMTILPARRVQGMIPAMAKKGRLQRGADADIVVFDPDTISDRATVAEPDIMSVGIDQVFVEGQQVMIDGELQRDVLPGRALRSA